MNTANIPPAILQQLMAQLQNLEAQGQEESEDEDSEEEIKSKELIPLTKKDTKLAKFMSTPDISYKGLEFGDIFLCNAFKVKKPLQAFQKLSQIYQGKELDQGVCGKLLTSGMVGYSCLDCQMDPTCIICKECFELGDHTGHRFQIKPHVSGMCDCGDPDAWKAQGNCSQHNGFINEDDYMPPEVKSKFLSTFKKCIYYTIQGFELNRTKKFQKKYSKCFKNFIEVCNALREQYPTLACLMGRAFCEDFSTDEIEEITLNHNCLDLTGEHPADPKPQKCDCTSLKALLRYVIWMDKSTQKDLTSFFMSLFVHEEFKTHLAIEYLRMINFNVNWDRIGKIEDDKKAVSKMSDMCIQLLTSEQLADLAIQKVTLKPFFESFIRIARKYKSPSNGYLYFDDLFYNKINLNIKYILMKKSGLVRTLKDREAIKLYFLFLEEVNQKKVRLVYDPDNADLSIEDNVNSVMFFEINSIRHWIELMSNLVSHEPEEVEEAMLTFLDEAKESIFRMQAYEDENFLNQKDDEENKFHPRTFSIPLQRMFIVAMIGFVYFKIQK